VRRLPIYLVIDTSYSMSGEPIIAVRNGIQSLLTALRQDPYALETAHIGVITFSSDAKQTVPLQNIMDFQEPDIEANGTTSLGMALDLLADCLTHEVNTKSEEGKKGDWRPLVFIMSDGNPTDDWKQALPKFKEAPTGMIVACAVGHAIDMAVLKALTDNVVQIDATDSAAFAAFFKWVSDSVKTTSQKIDLTKKEATSISELPPPPAEVNIVT
jgi:uncharacterized protein YegL